jgi:exo-beta-1,3-glucanase (GH17 family)
VGVCYGPHRDGQRPGGPTPTKEQILEDLEIMRPHWDVVRLYGSVEFGRSVLDCIRGAHLDMKVLLGAWIAPEERRDDGGALVLRYPEVRATNLRETEAAIALATDYPDIVSAVCVGNETQVSWSSHRCALEVLVGYIRRVRAAVEVPVTTADDYQYWLQPESSQLAREVDFITLHAHPLWNGQQLSEALPWLQQQVAAVRAVHPGRQLVLGETGWPTSKSGEGEQAKLMKGSVGEVEQATYYREVKAWRIAEPLPTFFFEAFDETWKGGADPDDAEKHWGFFKADRTPKVAVQ